MAQKFISWDETMPTMVKKEDRPFQAKHFFLYGPLTNPHLLTRVLNRSETPEFPHAKVFGLEILYHRDFPAATNKGTENPIDGVVCRVRSRDELNRLEAYMTSMFRVDVCMAWLDDGTKIPGFVFVWDGGADILGESPSRI